MYIFLGEDIYVQAFSLSIRNRGDKVVAWCSIENRLTIYFVTMCICSVFYVKRRMCFIFQLGLGQNENICLLLYSALKVCVKMCFSSSSLISLLLLVIDNSQV